MLYKQLKTGEKKENFINKTKNLDEKLGAVKNINESSSSSSRSCPLESPVTGLNFWGAGPMNRDFML